MQVCDGHIVKGMEYQPAWEDVQQPASRALTDDELQRVMSSTVPRWRLATAGHMALNTFLRFIYEGTSKQVWQIRGIMEVCGS